MRYILEVLEFIPGKTLVHVGYMDKVFLSKEEAAEYYNEHNPHMRGLNAHGEWRSDWDWALARAWGLTSVCSMRLSRRENGAIATGC